MELIKVNETTLKVLNPEAENKLEWDLDTDLDSLIAYKQDITDALAFEIKTKNEEMDLVNEKIKFCEDNKILSIKSLEKNGN